MHDPIPSCFRGVASATPPATTAVGPTLTTSVYETHLGLAALTWSRTVLGLSLRAELRLPSSSSFCSASSSVSSSAVSSSDSGFDSFSFRIRPWILWKRRGTKRFLVKNKDQQTQQQQNRKVDFAWDLTRASFPIAGGPEPTSGFFVAVAVEGEMFLIVGDSPEEEAYKKTKTKKPISSKPSSFIKGSPGNPIVVSRSEHVFLPDSGAGRPYTTNAKMGGKQREISIDLGGGREKDARLCVGLDGKRVLQVKRLRWKFRGNERVNMDSSSGGGGGRIQVSWDVHNWLFNSAAASGTANSAELGHAVFVFRFDRNEAEGQFGKSGGGGGPWGMYGLGYLGNSDRSLSSSSTISGGGGRRRKRSLLKTSSSSSSASTASTASSSSVLGWASAEENELKESDGFFLVVYIWKR